MGAVWMLGRAEIRRGWRSLVALTLLVGLVGAVGLGAAAGARRTASALVVGVPLGVVVGRLVWRAVAEGVGVPVEVGRPWLAIALLVPAVVLAANLVAYLPARAAARVRPAVVLRSE